MILVVDDQEANRHAFAVVLRSAGFRVAEADCAAGALRSVALERPDLILLDVRLPDLDGFAVCRRIKADPATRHIPVLQTSAEFVSTTDKVAGLEGGADGYLAGPVEPAELLGTVRSLLRMRRAEEALRESEAVSRAMLDSAADHAIFMVDPAGTILNWNTGAARLMGWTAAEAVGRPAAILFTPEDVAAGRPAEELACALACGRSEDRRWHLRKDGRRFWANGVVTPVPDGSGGLRGFVKVLRDETDRLRTEEERDRLLEAERSAREAAETANRSKDEFLATLSHELRNPLSAIIGWAGMLRTGMLGEEEAAHALETIERSARAQTQLIADLLDVSRIITGKLLLDARPVSLADAVRGAADSVRFAAESKGVALRRDLPPGVVAVLGDPDRLQQAVWNLLSNAVKFTPAGGEVTVRLESEPGRARIVVADNGKGIPPEFLPHVFQRFRQADSGSARAYGGLGLGLAIVRHIVDLHGGPVRAESEGEGRGARFTIELPIRLSGAEPPPAPAAPAGDQPARAEAASEAAPESGANGPALDAAGRPLRGRRLLLVDDEEEARRMTATLLRKLGAEVRTASSAAECAALLAADPPDVLISDVGMPHEDGYSLIRRVRAMPPDRGGRVPAVALTAYASERDRNRLLDAGFDAHLPKPVRPSDLVGILAALAGGRPQPQPASRERD
jgi:PAS domain S-box-containing protein